MGCGRGWHIYGAAPGVPPAPGKFFLVLVFAAALHKHLVDVAHLGGQVGRGLFILQCLQPGQPLHLHALVHFAVKRMLPKKNTLARHMLAKLKVYAGTEHRHAAQQPKPLEI